MIEAEDQAWVIEALRAQVEAQKTQIQELTSELSHVAAKNEQAQHFAGFITAGRQCAVVMLHYGEPDERMGIKGLHRYLDSEMPSSVAETLKQKTLSLEDLALTDDERNKIRRDIEKHVCK